LEQIMQSRKRSSRNGSATCALAEITEVYERRIVEQQRRRVTDRITASQSQQPAGVQEIERDRDVTSRCALVVQQAVSLHQLLDRSTSIGTMKTLLVMKAVNNLLGNADDLAVRRGVRGDRQRLGDERKGSDAAARPR
jgi:hypothetical protein